ncbi:hypothetical protein ACTQ6A_01700 [Lachnospiraceae bacterium LCP25S3_G4]
MLKKLIKHEFLATYRILLLLHGFMLLAAFIGRFFVNSFFNKHLPEGAFVLFIISYIAIISIMAYGTFLFIAARFYKSLFTDEGYLTFTLPVTNSQLLLSKTISGALWSLLDMIVMYLSVAITFATPYVLSKFNMIQTELEAELQITVFKFIITMFTLSIVGCISGTLMLYVSVSIGQLFTKHRLLGAVVTYFVISFIIQIIVTASMLLSGMIPIGQEIAMGPYLSFTFNMSTISGIILAIISYVITYYVMNKKTNLN